MYTQIGTEFLKEIKFQKFFLNLIEHYTTKFEIFDDRIEITSAGSLPKFLSIDEFFDEVSVPRNKELIRVFKDLELVEQLGSGLLRILQFYGRDFFRFTENFIKTIFNADEEVLEYLKNEEKTEHVQKLISLMEMDKEYSRNELIEILNITHREYFGSGYLEKAINLGLIEMTIPDKPKNKK